MQILNEIDKLPTQLNNLKPELSDDLSNNEKNFTKLLNSNIDTNTEVTDISLDTKPIPSLKVANGIPSWVDQDYGYDPENPRKPNMRELMEAISGKDVEELYSATEDNWRKTSGQASEILYGVIGSNADTRDWNYIMASENILKSAQEQTGVMYEPTIEILSEFDNNNKLIEQKAMITDNVGNILRPLSSHPVIAEETLRNFGATSASIPKNLDDKVDPNIFDKQLLGLLRNFDKEPASIEQIVVQSASKVIANKISQEIPSNELAKL